MFGRACRAGVGSTCYELVDVYVVVQYGDALKRAKGNSSRAYMLLLLGKE